MVSVHFKTKCALLLSTNSDLYSNLIIQEQMKFVDFMHNSYFWYMTPFNYRDRWPCVSFAAIFTVYHTRWTICGDMHHISFEGTICGDRGPLCRITFIILFVWFPYMNIFILKYILVSSYPDVGNYVWVSSYHVVGKIFQCFVISCRRQNMSVFRRI